MVVKWGIPESEQRSVSMLNRSSREIGYALTWWRARFQRWSRRFSDMLNRIRPKRGRINRLRTEVEQSEFHRS
jgi:hypothetical protein